MTTTPLCRCRVLYIGSAVPTVTKDGLQGIQEPLRERYPVDETVDTKGIDSWMSVWSNGILLEYIEGDRITEAAFFPIQSLHYCAAVRYVNVSGYEVGGGGHKFLPLDSPFANLPDSTHPPIFAAIMRRTTGVKVLECHAFICTNTKAANALVKSCFHAYADSMYLKVDADAAQTLPRNGAVFQALRDRDSSRSSTPRSSDEGPPPAQEISQDRQTWQRRQQMGDYDTASISSSLAGRYKKKDKRITNGSVIGSKKAASELGGQSRGQPSALVPVGYWNQRRAGSAQDIYGTMGSHPGPPQSMMGPPPPGPPPQFMMPQGMPPGMQQGMSPGMPPHMMGPMMMPHGMPQGMPHGMPPPPPPHMMGPPGQMGPGSMGPGPMGPMGPPPPGAYPMGPPPPEMYGPPPHPMLIPPHHPGMVPDSPYATFPRGPPNGIPGRSFEEPIYMPGQMPPPHGQIIAPSASYHPSAYTNPAEQYEAYYDSQSQNNNRQQHEIQQAPSTLSKKKRGPGSTVSSVEPPADFYQWEDRLVYGEGGIFKKTAYLNEKAFGSAMQHMEGRPVEGRPVTPPADYSPKASRLQEDMNSLSVRDETPSRGTYMMY